VRAGARAPARTYEGGAWNDQSNPSDPSAVRPRVILGFDLETPSAAALFTRQRGYAAADGTGFARLCGITGPSGENAIVPVGQLLALLGAADEVYGHNILGFDGQVLAWHHGLDWAGFCAKARDTEIIARQAFPPRSRESGSSQDRLGLDAVAALLGLPGKTDDLKALARKHGGYECIPVDDPEFRAYLAGDLDATRGVAGQLLRHYYEDPYLPREHRLAGLAGQMSLNGFTIDQPLLRQRMADGEQRKAQALQLLHEGWGLPLTKTVTRGRGTAKVSAEVTVESPLATDAGREWLAGQWARYQVPDPPRTEKAGKLALGDDALKPVAADPHCPADLRAMIALMSIVTGTRTVYQNAATHLAPDGRVHPKISMRQASGRWSTTDPGLTVFGKHEGRHVERDIFTADPGHVLFSADLSQVDMRGIAALCQDPAYMAIFADASRDAHAEIAAQVFGDPHGGHCPKDCQLRQDAKARGHGWNYGLGPKRMIEEGADPGMVYSFVNGMAERFPVLCSWREEIRAAARAGQILDTGFGRRMRAEPARAYTVAPALMGQGSAGDIMKQVLLRLDERAPELRPYYRVMVHDEQVFSVPERDAEEIIHTVREAFTWEFRGVPITCDVNGPGRTWGEISAK
jgi:DNA polymerase-1